ncbi:dihydroorotase [Candidatus Gracilibacteria bacterium 28_42_T64]|nr:dihydroorotase [Candidatus Gracilibacteria bacterium 28_42_T64]
MSKQITIIQPDDWHVHFRDGDLLNEVAPITAQTFGRALVMPNLIPPITTVNQALDYKNRVMRATSNDYFTPYMTLYLTDQTTVSEIRKAAKIQSILAAKLYPAGATTNSDAGVTDIKEIYPVLDEMQKHGMTLCLHGEVTHGWIFDREAGFISEVLKPLREEFPELPIVLEHITTKEAVEYVLNAKGKIGATITPQHLLFNGNDMLVGGIKPHLYCLPILKKDTDQEALIKAATSGNSKFFLGTDSAPHLKNKKISTCGCAGCFTGLSALQMYAQVFDSVDALDKLETFASISGANFYGLETNTQTITLEKTPMTVPKEYRFSENDEDILIPLMHGEKLEWSIVNN